MNEKRLQFNGKKFKRARKLAGLTQDALAQIVNKHKQYVSNYEREVAKPSADDLLTYMNVLNVSAKDIAS